MTWVSLASVFNLQMSLVALGAGCFFVFGYLYLQNYSGMVEALRRVDPGKWKSIGCPQPFGKVASPKANVEESKAWTRFSMAVDLHADPEIAGMQKRNRVFFCVTAAGVLLVVAGAVAVPLYKMVAPGS